MEAAIWRRLIANEVRGRPGIHALDMGGVYLDKKILADRCIKEHPCEAVIRVINAPSDLNLDKLLPRDHLLCELLWRIPMQQR